MRESIRNEIVRLHYGGASQRRIAKLLGIARRSVARVLADHEQHRTGAVEQQSPRRPSLLGSFRRPHRTTAGALSEPNGSSPA